MLDSGFMPLVSKGSDRNLFGCRCAIATREKTMVLFMEQLDCLPYTLFLKQLSIASNLMLEGVRMIT